jgi:hypothetical protein
LLTRLLHFSPGALGIASGNILLIVQLALSGLSDVGVIHLAGR